MKSKKTGCILLVCVLVILTVIPSYGASTQEKISDTQAQKQETEKDLNNAESIINSLESKKDKQEAYLNDLEKEMEILAANLADLEKRSAEKQSELEKVQAELAAAQETEASQYESMKLRIQYMYENSGTTYIEMLFSSDNFTDFLNRAEQISSIAIYDRDMLKAYQETKALIAAQETAIQEEQTAIVQLQDESALKQNEVQDLIQATYDQIRTYSAEISESESAVQTLLNRVSSQEEALNTLIKQAKDEEVAAQRAAQERAAQEKAAKEEAQRQAAASKSDSNGSTSANSGTGNNSSNSSSSDLLAGSVGKNDKEESKSDISSSETESTKPSTDEGNSSGKTLLGSFRLTAYCNCSKCCGAWANGQTASGTTPSQGRTVAMGGVPFGTKLLINGNVYTVEDRGTAYGHVDVYHNSHSEALAFGSQYAQVYQLN